MILKTSTQSASLLNMEKSFFPFHGISRYAVWKNSGLIGIVP